MALARAEPEAMLGAMADHGVTFFAGVTTMFGKLVQHLESRDGPAPASHGCGCASPAASRGTKRPSRAGSS